LIFIHWNKSIQTRVSSPFSVDENQKLSTLGVQLTIGTIPSAGYRPG
jgi:hypothetical protein